MADTVGGLGGLGGFPVGDSAPYSQDQSQSILDYLLSKLSGIGHGVADAAKYPGDVYAGRKQLNDPETGRTSEDAVGKAFDLAGLASLGAAPGASGTVNSGIRTNSPLQDIFAQTLKDMAARKEQATALAQAGVPVRMQNRNGLMALVGPDMSRNNGWRVTHLDKAGPMGHVEYDSGYDALYNALRDGYSPK